MDYFAFIISIIALAAAGFAFLRASSSHRILGKRIEKMKDSNAYLEERLRRLEGAGSRGRKQPEEAPEPGRGRNQPRQEQQLEQPREPRHKQRDRQKQPGRQPQEQPSPERQSEQPEGGQQGHPRRKKENRRRNEPMDRNRAEEQGEQQTETPGPVSLEFTGGDLLAELEQAAGQQHEPVQQVPEAELVQGGKKYAIIPEDGIIRQHQLQQQPESDSYIEVDVPADGRNMTRYRFNLAGNHAFVISQGIDRLENAFSFEKPSNRMVSQIVQQGDGVLSRVGNGWKIEEKARINFR